MHRCRAGDGDVGGRGRCDGRGPGRPAVHDDPGALDHVAHGRPHGGHPRGSPGVSHQPGGSDSRRPDRAVGVGACRGGLLRHRGSGAERVGGPGAGPAIHPGRARADRAVGRDVRGGTREVACQGPPGARGQDHVRRHALRPVVPMGSHGHGRSPGGLDRPQDHPRPGRVLGVRHIHRRRQGEGGADELGSRRRPHVVRRRGCPGVHAGDRGDRADHRVGDLGPQAVVAPLLVPDVGRGDDRG